MPATAAWLVPALVGAGTLYQQKRAGDYQQNAMNAQIAAQDPNSPAVQARAKLFQPQVTNAIIEAFKGRRGAAQQQMARYPGSAGAGALSNLASQQAYQMSQAPIQALQMALGQANTLSDIYGQQAGAYGQQAQQAGGGLASLAQAWANYQNTEKLRRQMEMQQARQGADDLSGSYGMWGTQPKPGELPPEPNW